MGNCVLRGFDLERNVLYNKASWAEFRNHIFLACSVIPLYNEGGSIDSFSIQSRGVPFPVARFWQRRRPPPPTQHSPKVCEPGDATRRPENGFMYFNLQFFMALPGGFPQPARFSGVRFPHPSVGGQAVPSGNPPFFWEFLNQFFALVPAAAHPRLSVRRTTAGHAHFHLVWYSAK